MRYEYVFDVLLSEDHNVFKDLKFNFFEALLKDLHATSVLSFPNANVKMNFNPNI